MSTRSEKPYPTPAPQLGGIAEAEAGQLVSGVDQHQLREQLARTPLERLDWLEEFLDAAEELRASRVD